MAYEAPKLVEVGDVHELTLGNPANGPQRDAAVWWSYDGDPRPSR